MKSKLILTILGLTVLGAAVFGTLGVHAQTSTNNPVTSLVEKLAQKFGLNQAEVQAVFNEHRSQIHAQMLVRIEERLNQAVTDGKITEAQKQLILDKHKEFQEKHEAQKETLQNLTPDERRAEIEKNKTELETWAKENGIDLQYLFPLFGHHHEFGQSMMRQ